MQKELKPVQVLVGDSPARGGAEHLLLPLTNPGTSSPHLPAVLPALRGPAQTLSVAGTNRSHTYPRENSGAPVVVLGSHSSGLQRTSWKKQSPKGSSSQQKHGHKEASNFLPCPSLSLIFTSWCLVSPGHCTEAHTSTNAITAQAQLRRGWCGTSCPS